MFLKVLAIVMKYDTEKMCQYEYVKNEFSFHTVHMKPVVCCISQNFSKGI